MKSNLFCVTILYEFKYNNFGNHMNHLTFQQIEALAFAGASLKLEANRYTASQLQSLALIIKSKGNTLTLTKTNLLSSQQLLSIAFSGSGHIGFEP